MTAKSKIIVNLCLDIEDDITWVSIGSKGMRTLSLTSGPETVLGFDPEVRRSLFGVRFISYSRFTRDYELYIVSASLPPLEKPC